MQTDDADPNIDVIQLFRRLAGRWRQTRTITPGGTYAGEATFVPIDNDRLQYAEAGCITLGDGQRLAAHRSYVFALQGARICVYFDEQPPRVFHWLDFSRTTARGVLAEAKAHHRCDADDYVSTYTIKSSDAFTVAHRVNGPRKGYVMTTDYVRIAAAGPR